MMQSASDGDANECIPGAHGVHGLVEHVAVEAEGVVLAEEHQPVHAVILEGIAHCSNTTIDETGT